MNEYINIFYCIYKLKAFGAPPITRRGDKEVVNMVPMIERLSYLLAKAEMEVTGEGKKERRRHSWVNSEDDVDRYKELGYTDEYIEKIKKEKEEEKKKKEERKGKDIRDLYSDYYQNTSKFPKFEDIRYATIQDEHGMRPEDVEEIRGKMEFYKTTLESYLIEKSNFMDFDEFIMDYSSMVPYDVRDHELRISIVDEYSSMIDGVGTRPDNLYIRYHDDLVRFNLDREKTTRSMLYKKKPSNELTEDEKGLFKWCEGLAGVTLENMIRSSVVESARRTGGKGVVESAKNVIKNGRGDYTRRALTIMTSGNNATFKPTKNEKQTPQTRSVSELLRDESD